MTMEKRVKLPDLEFVNETFNSYIGKNSRPDTLVVTDPHNYPGIRHAGPRVVVFDNRCEQIEKIKSGYKFSNIIVVGGCSALDIARACASGKKIVVMPAILSTSCLSSDRSVIKYDGENILEKTTLPYKTVICLKEILSTPYPELSKWCMSGFGDLFTAFGASIELEYKKGVPQTGRIIENIPECMRAAEWVVSSFKDYDEDSIRHLALFLHESSLVVVQHDSTRFNAAGEHALYHVMIKQQKTYTNSRPTHGQLVAMGTLIEIKIFCEASGDHSLYDLIMKVFKKLRLPRNYEELSDIGIERGHIIGGLKAISAGGTFLGDYFVPGDFSILDRMFERKPLEGQEAGGGGLRKHSSL